MGIIINDLYSVGEPNVDTYIKEVHIHLTELGSEACAKQIAALIKSL